MQIGDFCDMQVFEEIMANWASATGLATVAVGTDGNYISKCYNFTDFCIGLTRGSAEGRRRCEECDRKGHGVYTCHAGLVDFAIDLTAGGQKVGSVIGGQVLPEHPDEERFRKTAGEIGVDPDTYIAALHRVNVRSREAIQASAALLGQVLNNYIHAEYARKQNEDIIAGLTKGVEQTVRLVEKITTETAALQRLQNKQKILALNASIEAARAGEHGAGFNVVAREVGKLSEDSSAANRSIEEDIREINTVVRAMQDMV